jgi:hypothetical protein
MFTVDHQLARLANVNPRVEQHGEKKKGACDLKIELTAHNDALDALHPTLRPFLFRAADQSGDQPTLNFESAKPLTALAMPRLKPLTLDEEWPGYSVTVGTALGKQKAIALEGCKLSNFRIEAIEGGSVKITFAVACHPTGPEIGKLSDLAVEGEIEITLTPPKASAQMEIEEPEEEEEEA